MGFQFCYFIETETGHEKGAMSVSDFLINPETESYMSKKADSICSLKHKVGVFSLVRCSRWHQALACFVSMCLQFAGSLHVEVYV